MRYIAGFEECRRGGNWEKKKKKKVGQSNVNTFLEVYPLDSQSTDYARFLKLNQLTSYPFRKKKPFDFL